MYVCIYVCVYVCIPSTILSLHKCAYRATSRLSVVLRINAYNNRIGNKGSE